MRHESEEPDNQGAAQERNADRIRKNISKKRVGDTPVPELPKSSTLVYVHSLLLFGERIFNRMIEFYGSLFDLTQKDKGKIYRNLSIHYINKSEHAKAMDLLKEWMRLEPSNPEASYQLAGALMATGNYRSALGVIGKTLKLAPHYKGALYRKGIIHIKLRNYGEAAELFEHFLEFHPRHARANYFLGISYDHADRIEKAVQALERAVEIAPEEVKYCQHLGFLYQRMGEHQRAAGCFSRIMELEQEKDEVN